MRPGRQVDWGELVVSSIGPMNLGSPREVNDLYAGVTNVLALACSNGRGVGNCRYGVYLFRDYDGEPIYVGQTAEQLRTRIRRHLTNQRTDAVAMNVLDPFEVDQVTMWAFWDFHDMHAEAESPAAKRAVTNRAKPTLDRAEFTVYNRALRESEFHVVLNEKPIVADQEIKLPEEVGGHLLSEEAREARNHPDVRLARRARTIANLAAVISERSVESGIRRTLLAQAQRLESLARSRLQALEAPSGGDRPEVHCGSLDEAQALLSRYAETLMTISDASSEDARARAGQDLARTGQNLVQVTQQIEAHGRDIARVVLELLGQDAGQNN